MRFLSRLIYLAAFFVFSVGCQTNELKQYEKLKVGMDKADVLGIMGSPKRTERRRGVDRWNYSFYQENQLYDKEVQFQNGSATYVGELTKPEISADDQDKMNADSNKAVEAQWAQQRIENRAQSSKYFNSEQADSQIRFVPQFQPVQ
jgi:outer membrane protein assembly factor BamE (lipoprotein component of BamABCDE complex)